MPVWTREQAREMAVKGNQVRWHSPPSPEPEPAIVPRIAFDDFAARKLLRVRGQIEQVEALLDGAKDAQSVDRYAAALMRLYDIEGWLSNRPKPGNRRPREDRAPRGAWTVEAKPLGISPAAPTPQDASNCGPQATTGSVPPATPQLPPFNTA